MARRPLEQSEQKNLFDESLKPGGGTRVFKSAADFASNAPKKKQYKRRDFSSTADAMVREVEAVVQLTRLGSVEPRDAWSKCDQRHLVALYAIMHREVYGELPGELAGDWMAACSSAAKLLREEFSDVPIEVVEYLRWSFSREKKREQRRSGDSGGWRLGWRYAFMRRELLTDYRVAVARMLKKHG